MENLSIAEIIKAVDGVLLSGNTDDTVSSVCIDTRKIKKNSLFVPLKGENVDGHSFLGKAFELGASLAFVKKGYDVKNICGAMIEVPDTLIALQKLAKYYRSKFDIPVIGVTGSVGKTTTKEMIATVLSESMPVLKTEGNYNGQIGLPLTIFNLNSEHKAAVLEMGVSKIGEMQILSEIANVDFGVITNIGLSHIENFINIETTCCEKMKLIKKESAKLYLNGDMPVLSKVSKYIEREPVYFGLNGNYKYKCEDVYSDNKCTYFTLVTSEFKDSICIPCLGIHNVYNALAAIAVSLDMGMHIDDIKNGLMKFQNVGMRQNIFELGSLTIIDDSYNASPDSVKSAVSVLKNIKGNRNIVVMADMLELGEQAHEIHFNTGRYIAIESVDILITIGEYAKSLADGAKSLNQNIQAVHCQNNIKAFEVLKNIIEENDKILIKGSRGMHTDEIVNLLKENFE